MVNNESVSDIFKSDDSEETCLQLVSRDARLKTKHPKDFSEGSCSSLNKSVQVNLEEMCSSRRRKVPFDTDSSESFKDENTMESISVSKSDSSSLDLHLSTESEKQSEESVQDSTSTNLSNESCLPEPSSSCVLPEHPARAITSSSGYKNSPDMFENSQEDFSQDQCFDLVRTNTSTASPEVLLDGPEPTGSVLSQADNRETVEEWSSQDLSDVSKNLKVRRKQIKRLIAAVIRKRQMEDETLEAFKKRLKRL